MQICSHKIKSGEISSFFPDAQLKTCNMKVELEPGDLSLLLRLMLIYVVTWSKSVLCSLFSFNCKKMLMLYRDNLKICGTKALYKISLLLLLIRLREIHGI